MYISNEGKILSEEKYQMADKIYVNMITDSQDTPLAKYGIPQNMSKDNLEDTITQLKLSILDWMQYCELYELHLDDVRYENNRFIALFNYDGNKVSMGID